MTAHNCPDVRDDSMIDGSDLLYRRVAKNNKYNFTPDRISGAICLAPGAFSLTDDDKKLPCEGMSGHLDSLMIKESIDSSKLVPDWTSSGVGRYPVSALRPSGGGIIPHEDKDDAILGKAHGLIRTPTVGMTRAEWKNIRDSIMKVAVYFDEDPGLSHSVSLAAS
ncbi:hypothetical protein [Rhodococcus sp. (in: high G+C Gram-positive bacteria)]|uniref:hypothetical protein n=1 Tax=Rhodococcus sp. TaxID=1831 RepID=UPI001A33FD6A|nr:hypothetical protein [Rhodococcus sp. (in: high G+C Gram-positive bacteria)]MBJ7481530.1 hypothetical protein [Rhodococcus sp. (in: high G+C Gram-positive bacteria)]